MNCDAGKGERFGVCDTRRKKSDAAGMFTEGSPNRPPQLNWRAEQASPALQPALMHVALTHAYAYLKLIE